MEVVVQRKGKDVVKVFQRRSLNPKKKEDAAQQVRALLALLGQTYKYRSLNPKKKEDAAQQVIHLLALLVQKYKY